MLLSQLITQLQRIERQHGGLMHMAIYDEDHDDLIELDSIVIHEFQNGSVVAVSSSSKQSFLR